MTDKKRRKLIENLSDGEFIDLLDTICGLVYGYTATEYIEYECKNYPEVKRVVEELK